MKKHLETHPSFDVDDPELAAKKLAESYVDHQITVAPGETIHAIHHQARLSTISINYLEYGAEVEISANRLEDFYLLQKLISGTTNYQSDDGEQLATRGTGLVIDCNTDVLQQWSNDCRQLQIKIDRKALEQNLNRMLGAPIKKPLRFDVLMDLDEPKIASWWRFIEYLVKEFESGDSVMTIGPAVAFIESAIMTNLLIAHRNNYSDALLDQESGVVPSHVKKAEDYIRNNIADNIEMDAIVKASGVSKRTLYDGFRRFRRTTPMNFLRSHRLEKVREDLLASSGDQSVTEIISSWGVTQFGRFASYYKLVYGESPSDTLKGGQA
jgi:AraC-like DNA-binding protein